MFVKGVKILKQVSDGLYRKNRVCFSLMQHVYGRQNLTKAMISELKEPLFLQQEELRHVESTIQEVQTFDQLKEFVIEYKDMIEKKKDSIDDLMEYYVILFLEKQINMEKSLQDEQQLVQNVRGDIIDTLNDLILKHLNNFSKESLLIILNLICESPIDDKRKFFRIFEYTIARTQFVMKMKEDQIASLLQNIEKIHSKGMLQQDVYIELIEKIEFAIVEFSMKDFEPADLTSILYIYSSHLQGTEALFNLLQDNFNRIHKQMSLQQQVLSYWSLVNSGYFQDKPVLSQPKCRWIEERYSELKPYYKILFTNAYTQQKHFYQRSFINTIKSVFQSS